MLLETCFTKSRSAFHVFFFCYWSTTLTMLLQNSLSITRQMHWKVTSNWRASCKEGIYRILAEIHFLQDQANFWQTDLFWHEKHRSIIILFWSICISRCFTLTYRFWHSGSSSAVILLLHGDWMMLKNASNQHWTNRVIVGQPAADAGR